MWFSREMADENFVGDWFYDKHACNGIKGPVCFLQSTETGLKDGEFYLDTFSST